MKNNKAILSLAFLLALAFLLPMISAVSLDSTVKLNTTISNSSLTFSKAITVTNFSITTTNITLNNIVCLVGVASNTTLFYNATNAALDSASYCIGGQSAADATNICSNVTQGFTLFSGFFGSFFVILGIIVIMGVIFLLMGVVNNNVEGGVGFGGFNFGGGDKIDIAGNINYVRIFVLGILAVAVICIVSFILLNVVCNIL